jgi:hypothetical protein
MVQRSRATAAVPSTANDPTGGRSHHRYDRRAARFQKLMNQRADFGARDCGIF